ncbi:ATP-dependent DNA helicase DinG [Evansella vedderi]|uniref:3'-5' exonuclease DinG n=1 Tax=Evansella vedderi TaxID=38282 RepID=A0ABU0A3A7_9BACI|nr:ATP-dependent DNA helicase DinG [Evansella vedderi]MDQ0257441.1 ATP-dependent DNA helicase DinG [Evansella vedderi]
MERFVVIDVETTGVSFEKGDRIIQVAYVVIQDNTIVERYSSYVNPKRSIPLFIQSLTNIDNTFVKEAPVFEEIAPKLLEALNGAFFVAHNVDFDLNFLNKELSAAGYNPFDGLVIDTVELAKIAFPTADGFRLSQLSKNFHMDHDQPHRADSDAEATGQLFIEILERLSRLPIETLSKLNQLAPRLKSNMKILLHRWMLQNDRSLQKDDFDYDYSYGLALRKVSEDEIMETHNGEIDFNHFFNTFLKNEKWCKERMEGFELRPGQLEMLSFIHETMKEGNHGLIEAGTGTGKTLAYLISAAFLAKEKNKRVIISTQTIQLQEQLLQKELPNAMKFLPFPIRIALLKGRSHYLCLQKFKNLLKNDINDTYDRAVSKAQILVWLTETETGDVEELSLATQNKRFWYEVSSDSYSCVTHSCFYQRARKRAQMADIVVTNHSLVLSDIRAGHQLLPAYEYIILDEGHHFEETATEQLGFQLDYLIVTQLLNESGAIDGDGFLHVISKTLLLDKEIGNTIFNLDEGGKVLKQEWYELFLLLYDYICKKQGQFNERGRMTVKMDVYDEEWFPVQESVDRFSALLDEWIKDLLKLSKHLEQHFVNELDIKQTLQAYIERVKKIQDTYNNLFINQQPEMIHWLEAETKGPKTSIFIKGRPVQVAEYLGDDFFSTKESVILTSATLTVSNKFKYMIQRLGLESFPVKTKRVVSPFHWDKQVQLVVPTDMPLIQESGEDAYIDAVVMQIYRLAQVTKGKMLVLFTSYDMLKKSYLLLKEMLEDEYVLIAQGVQTGSRNKLTRNFQQFEQAILLGSSSFWEGVDIPGRNLSVIVIVRLPFTPPDDPVFQAKSALLKEAGENPFMKLALPQAVIRFKQGFGRLIRRSSDRGIVVVLDRRIISTRYGKSFIKSLPNIPLMEKPMDELENDILKWL